MPRRGASDRHAGPAEPLEANAGGEALVELTRQLLLARGRLRTQQVRQKAILENLAHGLSLYDKQGRLVLCNQQFLDIYRLPPALGKRGTTFRRILEARVAGNAYVGEDGATYVADRLASVSEHRPLGGIHRLNSGQVISMTHQPMADGGWVSTHKDVTELFNMQAELTHLAYHDPLTGLPNRALFSQRVTRAFDAIGETGRFAVLCLDLDGFKPINDMLGHATGDALLRQFAGRLSRVLGPDDSAARMGGDEFAVLHAGGDQPSALALAARIAEASQAPFDFDGEVVSVAVGIGIACAPADGGDIDELLHSADLALYAAKREKRGGTRCFERDMDLALEERRRTEHELRRALENGEFELHYQPILNLATQTFSGFEALLRWRHPERGLVSPASFIPIAEEMGLIVPIGEWVIREAFAEAARWPADLRVAVNVSSIQLRRGNLVATVMNALAASGLGHNRAEIEITESVFLEHSEQSLETLRQLRALGIRVVLDDFGTGYSALGYLIAFPFDKIKIDGAFVRALAEADGARTIVEAVADIGDRMAMSTTAEGIETPEQLRAVHLAGYTEAQGYLIARPMPREAVRRLLDGAYDSMPDAPLEAAAPRRGMTTATRRNWRFAPAVAMALLLLGLLLRYIAHLQTGGLPSLAAFADAMCRWDCLWYGDIAAHGYDSHPNQEGQAGWAFFPLTPLLLGVTHRLSGLPVPLVGMLVGAAVIWLAALAARPLYGGNRRAFLVGSALLLAGPGSFYFTTGYSEGLFLLFTALAFAALRRNDYAGAGLAAAFLSASRLVGVLMMAVLLLHAVLAHRRTGRLWRELPGLLLADGRLLVGLALAPLGLVAYMAWLHFSVGDALAFLRAQEAWGRYLDWPWLQLWDAFTSGFAAYLIWSVTAVFGLVLALLLLARRRYPESLFSGLGLVIPLSSAVISMPRFIVGQLPFYVLVAELAASRAWLAVAVAAAAVGLGYATALGWLSNISYLT